MDYVKLGHTGLEVSRICLGCMTFGVADRGQHPWTLDEAESRPILKKALDLGINFFDTANVYSDGTSEEIVGRVLKDLGKRDEVVIATKVHGRMRPGPNGAGLSRRAILAEIDNSLRRLGTDFVDLYQIHRWDPNVPVAETLEALHDVVKSGKARYIGASSMYAWQFAKALYTSRQHGWTEFVSMQNHLNLLNREEEREMLPLCIDQNVAVLRGARWRAAVWRVTGTSRPSGKRPTSLARRSMAFRTPIATSWRGSAKSPRHAACRARKSHSPGCCRRTASLRRSSAHRSRGISTTPSPLCRCA